MRTGGYEDVSVGGDITRGNMCQHLANQNHSTMTK